MDSIPPPLQACEVAGFWLLMACAAKAMMQLYSPCPFRLFASPDVDVVLRAVPVPFVQGEGYHRHFQGCSPASDIGEGVATVFSAPMYTTHSNRGGVLVVRGDGGVDALGYDAAPEPILRNRSVCFQACENSRRCCTRGGG